MSAENFVKVAMDVVDELNGDLYRALGEQGKGPLGYDPMFVFRFTWCEASIAILLNDEIIWDEENDSEWPEFGDHTVPSLKAICLKRAQGYAKQLCKALSLVVAD